MKRKEKYYLCTEIPKYKSRYIYLDNYKLEQVSEFSYLGSMITLGGKDKKNEETRRNGKNGI